MLSGAILSKTREISQSETFRHFAVLLSGKAGVYFISLISQPLLARLYTPAQFGEFAFLNSILAILLIGASGRFEAGIVLSHQPQKAVRLFQLAQFVLFGYVLCLSVFICFAPSVAQKYFNEQGLSSLSLWIVPLVVLFSGNWQIVHNWLIRFEKFSQISFALVFQRVLIFGTAVIAFYLQTPVNGLILSLFIGSVGIFILSLLLQRHSLVVPLKRLLPFAYHFRDFPLFSVPTQFLHMLLIHFPVLCITFFYDKENAGAFGLAYSLTSVPLHLLHVSLGQIFYQRLAQCEKSGQISLTLKYCKLYAAFLVPVIFVTTAFGNELTYFFLGNSWAKAGEMMSSMSFLMLIQGMFHLFTYIVTVRRKQQLNLFLQLFQFVLCVLAFAIGFLFKDIILSLWLLVLFNSFHLACTIFLIVKSVVPSQNAHKNKLITAN